MPHLIIEYSANVEERIDLDGLMDVLHGAALETGVFPIGGLRIRAHRVEHYRVADRHPANAFVHVTALVGQGRPLDVRQRAGSDLFAALTNHLSTIYDESPLAISFNMQELPANLSFKKNNLHRYVAERGGAAASKQPAGAR